MDVLNYLILAREYVIILGMQIMRNVLNSHTNIGIPGVDPERLTAKGPSTAPG